MPDARRDPDALLARIRDSEAREAQGRLKIFFGAAAGVGKTYAMLVEAHERRRSGVAAVVGIVETHGRPETAALLEGFETLPHRNVDHRGTALHEFDLDRALVRRPELLLLDELAHTNAPGSRHAKRWQDVEELLAAGIDVYTTLNVQHVESLWDAVAEITGVHVRETVPDSIIDRADEIEIVDLPPDDLLQRLREGKVYVAPQVERALENFFRKGNLIALRELALRRTAERVDAQMDSYRKAHALAPAASAGGRLLVCVGKPATAPRLVRAARRMAAALKVPWTAVFVERPGDARDSPKDHEYLTDVLSFAEELGADTAVLSGHRIADELLAYAREHQVTRILIGKPRRSRARELLFGSIASALMRAGDDVDVFVLRGEGGAETPAPARDASTGPTRAGYARALAIVVVCTAISWLLRPHFEGANLIMVYLLGVVLVAVRFGRGPAVLASVLSVAAFDFFFVPPHFTFAVSDTQYAITFAVMLAVALLLSSMAVRLREQSVAARERERRTAALYRLSRELARSRDLEELLAIAVRVIEETFGARAVILLPDAAGRATLRSGDAGLLGEGDHERSVAQWVLERGEAAGLGTQTLPGAGALYVPLRGARRVAGVLGVVPERVRLLLRPDQFRLLEACADQTALALERALLASEAERSRVRAESERLQNTLLGSVSHDLRTPLAGITGAASSLLAEWDLLSPETRAELLTSVVDEATRLNRLVGNLLDVTRIESGALRLRRQWNSVEEVVGAALSRLGPRLAGREVTVHAAPELGLVSFDEVLVEQALVNLIDNAARYTPAGSAIEIQSGAAGRSVWIEVVDHGPGLPPGEEERVFDKFYRARGGDGPGGIGLGLTISRGIAEAHGGSLTAENAPGGGAVFRITLPREGEPPAIDRGADLSAT